MEQGLVRWRLGDRLRKVYALTPPGQQRVARLTRLLRVLDHEDPGGSRLPRPRGG